MESFFLIVLFFIIFLGLGYGIMKIGTKYFGVRMVGRGQLLNSIDNSQNLKKRLTTEDPVLVDKAINECKRKHLVRTPENIYLELDKLKYPKKTKTIFNNGKNKISILRQNKKTKFVLENISWINKSSFNTHEVWIFIKDKSLIISKNGIVETGKWEYFLNSESLFIEIGNEKRLYNIKLIDNTKLSITLDGTNKEISFVGKSNNKKIEVTDHSINYKTDESATLKHSPTKKELWLEKCENKRFDYTRLISLFILTLIIYSFLSFFLIQKQLYILLIVSSIIFIIILLVTFIAIKHKRKVWMIFKNNIPDD